MCKWKKGSRSLFLTISLIVCGAGVVDAANGIWRGTTDSYWDRDSNWSGTTRPCGDQTATFKYYGNGNKIVNLTQLGTTELDIMHIVFASKDCNDYTLGSAPDQRLWLRHYGTLTIDADVIKDQTIAATTQYGHSATGSTVIKLINNSPVAKLLLNGANEFTIPSKSGLYVGLKFEGVGDITFNDTLKTNGLSRLYLYNHNSGTLTFAGAGENRINYLATMNSAKPPGNTRVVLNSGSELFVDRKNENYSIWHEGEGVIEGAGTLRLGTGGGEDFARIYIKTGSKLTIKALFTSEGGLEMFHGTGGGTLVLDCINNLSSNLVVSAKGGAVSVARIGNRGSIDSNIGRGQRIQLTGLNSGLIYTGTGETTDRLFEFSANVFLDQSGAGDLILSEDLVVGANTKTLTLTGSTEGVGEIAGVIGPGSDTTSLAKDGSGLWRLTAANTYAGTTTIGNGTLALTGADGAITTSSGISLDGGVLRLENNADSNNVDRLGDTIPLTMNGGTLGFAHTGGATNYSESVGALIIGEGETTVSAAQADEGYTSTLTFASLNRSGDSTISFTGVGLGADNRNRILFATPPPLVNGYIGPWATVNGTELAKYDAALGVIPGPSITIAARGPDSVIPDNATLSVQITTEGTEGPITLEGGAGASIYSLTQMTAIPAVVATINKTLTAYSVVIDQDAGALTIGENAGDGTLQAGAGDRELILANLSTNALTVNAAIVGNNSAMALAKTGPGVLNFNGLVDVTGHAAFQEGTLTFGNVAGQMHKLGSMTVTGGAERPTMLNIDGPIDIINSGNIAHASLSSDRCVMNIASDLTVQGNLSTNGLFEIGSGEGSAGAVIQKAGAISISSGRSGTAFLTIANHNGYGYYRMTGGSCIGGEIAIGGGRSTFGGSNVSVFDLYDGELTVDRWCLLIAWARGIGSLNIFGGSFSGAGLGGEVIFSYNDGSSITAQLNLLGSTAKMFDKGLAEYKLINLARGVTNTLGVVNLNNGELTLYSAFAKFRNGALNPTTPTHFNFNGGLLIAASNNTELMQGLTAAHVSPGGARIDTAGYDITINQPLVAPTGYGVSEIAFGSGGAGYIGAPAVLITGGSGIGATAIALVDLEAESQSCGQVTNILVTSAGSGYGASDNLVATLLGGGYLTPAAAGAVTLSANTSGSLTKTGAGTLRLGGGGTYSGATIVSNGTLLINGAHAGGGSYTFASGTTLGGTGTVALASGTVELLAGATLAVDPTSEDGDRLTVSSLTLSDNLVAVKDIDLLDKTVNYPILTCSGTITGKLATQIADSGWGVKLIGDTFYLRSNAGTLILIR